MVLNAEPDFPPAFRHRMKSRVRMEAGLSGAAEVSEVNQDFRSGGGAEGELVVALPSLEQR